MFKKILVPLDHSPLAEQALDIAAEIAKACGGTADLVLVHQRLLGIAKGHPFDAAMRMAEDQYLESVVAELQRDQKVAPEHAVLVGDPVEMISARAHDVAADLIVMTSHGRTGVSRAWLGSVADGVARGSRIPVLILRPVADDSSRGNVRPLLRRIVVPLDGSAASASILGHVSALARCLQASITLLRIVQPSVVLSASIGAEFAYPLTTEDDAATRGAAEEAKRELSENAHQLEVEGCTAVAHHVVVSGSVARTIVDFVRSHQADLVAMSTHGRGASRLLIGSVADKVLRDGGAPVLLYRPRAGQLETH